MRRVAYIVYCEAVKTTLQNLYIFNTEPYGMNQGILKLKLLYQIYLLRNQQL